MVFARLYNTCFLHTLERLVRGYKLSRFCTLPRKSRRFIAREQKLVYSIHSSIVTRFEGIIFFILLKSKHTSLSDVAGFIINFQFISWLAADFYILFLQEGKQASLAADFSITQFSFIGRLLMVHGRNR